MFKTVLDAKTDKFPFPFPFPFPFSISARVWVAFAVFLIRMHLDTCLSNVMTQPSVTDGNEVLGDGGTH